MKYYYYYYLTVINNDDALFRGLNIYNKCDRICVIIYILW